MDKPDDENKNDGNEILLPRRLARADGGVHSHPVEEFHSAEDAADIDRLVGREVANLRVQRAITEGAFCATLRIAKRTLRDLEAGRSRFDPYTLVRAARILGVSPSAIFRDVAEKFALDLLAEGLSVPKSPDTSIDLGPVWAKLFRVVGECDDMIRVLESISSNLSH